MSVRSLTILGSTGSIGKSTLEVVRANPGSFKIQALTANQNVDLLAEQAREFNAALAVIGDESKYAALKERLKETKIEVAAGRAALTGAAAMGADITMAGIVGMAGLESVIAAIRCGKRVAIANKEPLVAAGPLILQEVMKSGATLLPVDSEHNAIFQVFEKENRTDIRRLILTASGGPFRTWDIDKMGEATPEQALAHPNWSMGAKISIDSATMMNKALEVIEAHYLFSMPPSQIDVVVHPQSVIHSMVEYGDGSVLAQMGPSDMRVPIAHALGWPNRIKNDLQSLDFYKLKDLTFESVDDRRFPAIKQAYRCLEQGSAACLAFNAANEVAVEAFLGGRIGFSGIYETVSGVLETVQEAALHDLESILAFDKKMRESAHTCIKMMKPSNRKVQ